MAPSAIVERARAAGLNAIAITDHNSALNSTALHDVCSRYDNFFCLYGMEMTSVEEVHLLALFDDHKSALDFGEFLYPMLADIPNNPDRFGDQVYVNADNEICGECDKYLVGALSCSMDELLVETHARGGIFIPAHIERPSFSIMSQLGFVPQGDYDALEQHYHYIKNNNYDGISLNAGGHPCTTASDAHYLDDIGRGFIEFEADRLTVAGLCDSLRRGGVVCRAV